MRIEYDYVELLVNKLFLKLNILYFWHKTFKTIFLLSYNYQ